MWPSSSPREASETVRGSELREWRESFRFLSVQRTGGESGIRTHGRVSPTHAFQACSFNHSDISPYLSNQSFTGEWMSPETRIVSEIVSDLLMSHDHLRA